MTRDEALKIVDAIPHPTPTHWVNCFVALGMLKLDEPSGESEKLAQEHSDKPITTDRVALGPHPDQPEDQQTAVNGATFRTEAEKQIAAGITPKS